MKTIVACVRGVNDFPKRVYFTCNPGGQGHGYIKRLFIDRRFESGENPADYAFIQALVRDNTALMQTQPEYIRQLEALPPHLREMWLEGRWDVFAGNSSRSSGWIRIRRSASWQGSRRRRRRSSTASRT